MGDLKKEIRELIATVKSYDNQSKRRIAIENFVKDKKITFAYNTNEQTPQNN